MAEGGEDEKRDCDECGRSFRATKSSKQNMAAHLASHKAPQHRQWKPRHLVCDACGLVAKQSRDLAHHFGCMQCLDGLKREKERAVGRCDWCAIETRHSDIWQHMRFCGCFPDAATFRAQHLTPRRTKKFYACDNCDWRKMMHTAVGLFRHWASRHSGRHLPCLG